MKSKLILILTLLLGILACGITTPTPTAEPAAEPAQLNAVPDVEEEKPVIIPTATFTPEPQEEIIEENPSPALSEVEGCVELLAPENNADLPAEGEILFSWTAHDSAESYSLNFIFPDELTLSFNSTETTKNRYMDGFSMHPAYNQRGEHQWNVTILNAAGEEICSSDFFTFTKPQTPENKPQGDGGGGGNDDDPIIIIID